MLAERARSECARPMRARESNPPAPSSKTTEGEKVKRMNIGTSCSKSKGWRAVPGLVSVLAERARADGARSMRAIEPSPATTLIICNDEVMSAKVNG